jgi:hypothetical protein
MTPGPSTEVDGGGEAAGRTEIGEMTFAPLSHMTITIFPEASKEL